MRQASFFRVDLGLDVPPNKQPGGAIDPRARIPRAGVAALARQRWGRLSSARVSWRFPGGRTERLGVGDPLRREFPEQLGILGERLTPRHVAFLLLVLGEQAIGRPQTPEAIRQSRERIRGRLGPSASTLDRWLNRSITPIPGAILRWRRFDTHGRSLPRSQGPWWIAADLIQVEPPQLAGEYIDLVAHETQNRPVDPSRSLHGARLLCLQDQWSEALLLLEDALVSFWRKDLGRNDPLWHELMLERARIEMQIGTEGLRPTASYNILRSVNRRAIGRVLADYTEAQARYIAALVLGQAEDPRAFERAIAHLDRAAELLSEVHSDVGERELLRTLSLREEAIAGRFGILPPEHASAILHAGESIEGSRYGKHVVYGDALLRAGQPAQALDYLVPALEVGLASPSRIPAKRAAAIARWRAGERSDQTLDELALVEEEARKAGLEHQRRATASARDRVRRSRT